MKIKLIIQLFMAVAFCVCHLQAQSVEMFIVIKLNIWEQTGPTKRTLIESNGEAAIDYVEGGNILNPQVIFPLGQVHNLTPDPEIDGHSYILGGSLQEIDAAFPNGLYQITGAGDSGLPAFNVNLNLGYGFADPPLITNYAALQDVDPSQGVTIQWEHLVSPAPQRFIIVRIDDEQGHKLYESDFLDGDQISYTIPSGVLPADTRLCAEVAFVVPSQFDEGTGPGGADMLAGYVSATEFHFPAQDEPEERAVAFFGADLFRYPGVQPGTSQWYFSFTFKNVYHFAGGNWFYFQEFDSFLWADINSGSLAGGFWAYLIHPQHSSWTFLGRDGNFYDLRDSNRDGKPDIPDDQAGGRDVSGYIFFATPVQGDPPGSAWYFFSQFPPTGNWMVNLKIPSPVDDHWVKVR